MAIGGKAEMANQPLENRTLRLLKKFGIRRRSNIRNLDISPKLSDRYFVLAKRTARKAGHIIIGGIKIKKKFDEEEDKYFITCTFSSAYIGRRNARKYGILIDEDWREKCDFNFYGKTLQPKVNVKKVKALLNGK